jgi:hypothetical protein
MFILAALIALLLLALAGSGLVVAQINPEELSNMGVQQK